jgi:thiamine-phosphate pyrophosphorylase
MFDLTSRRLYLCTALRDDLVDFVRSVIEGGVDIVQLRDKHASRSDIVRGARELQVLCRDLGVPFIVNDVPEIAAEVGADGVHVGQDDVSVAHCRSVLGESSIVGLSTHSPADLEDALDQPVSYLSAGPVSPTPTKPGRAGTGIEYATDATAKSAQPVFVTGGVTPSNIGELAVAGVRHFVVVRYLTESLTPRDAARELRDAIEAALSSLPTK